MTFTQLPHPEVIACTGSTNHLLADSFEAGQLQPFASVIARHQRSGRGRLGHEWFAPCDSSLLFSAAVTIPASIPTERLGWLSLISSLAVSELISNEVGTAATIKWPNDVLLDGRKVCGILTQYLGQRNGLHWVCVGIGLNLAQSSADLDGLSATSLSQHGWSHTVTPAVLTGLAEDLTGILYRITRDLDEGAAAYREACATLERDVTATLAAGEAVTGLATGLNPNGALLINTGTEIVTVTAGQVTLGTRPSALPTGPEVSLSTTCKECK